jgi:hypothetical protein
LGFIAFMENPHSVSAAIANGLERRYPTVPVSLLLHRRGLSNAEIEQMIDQRRLLRSLLKGRELRKSAIKMEMTRLRRDIDEALKRIGTPYGGDHFLPFVPHGLERYRLAGNWQLSHAPVDVWPKAQ